MNGRQNVRRFQELDFYSDDEKEESFSEFLSDIEEDVEEETEEEIEFDTKEGEDIEIPKNSDISTETDKNNNEIRNEGISLLDSLLGEALSGEQINPPIKGLFDDLELPDFETEIIDRNKLEDDDSGISSGASRSASVESQVSPVDHSQINDSNIDRYLQFLREEELAVSEEDIPDFASKKNVYGTSFNVRTGAISRPPRFDFARHDDNWIESCKAMTYENDKPVNQLLTFGRIVTTVKLGMKIDNKNCKFTDVFFRSAKDLAAMETIDIQKDIQNAFNSRRLAAIFFGVDSDGTVLGCPMDACKQDNLRLALDTAVQTEFVPPIENILDAIDLQFLPVEDSKDSFLVVIRVKQLRNQNYHLESAV